MSHSHQQPVVKKVGMILDIDFPPDDRPEKEARSLIDAGFEVYLLCITKTNKPEKETYHGIKITRFIINQQIRKKLSSAYLVLPFYRWIWNRQIKRFIIDNEIDILHVHDLPFTDIANRLAAEYNLKVVCDQHEYWSNWIGKTAHYNTVLGKILNNLSNWKKFERDNLRKADLVITVTEPLRRRYIDDVGIEADKIIAVPNTPSRSIFQEKQIDEEIMNKYSDKFVLLYAGVMSVLRGVDIVIKSLKELEKSIPNIRFVLAGRFSRNCNPPQMAQNMKVGHLVEYAGWVPVNQLPSYMNAANICVHLPNAKASAESNNTIATKIYQYAAMGKPIIISEAKMMKNFVLQNGLGESIKNGDISEFIQKVLKIHSNYQEYAHKVKKNSDTLLKNKSIFWEDTVKDMIDFYKRELIFSEKINEQN